MQELHAGRQRLLRRVIDEDLHKRCARKEIQHRQRDTQRPHKVQTRAEAAADAVRLLCAEVLRREVRNAVAQRHERRDDEVVQLDRRGIARHNGRAERIDDTLQHDIADGDEALLQDTRDGDARHAAEQSAGEDRSPLALRQVDLRQTAEHEHQRQHAAHALAQERCPRNAVHAHAERRDEQDIHRDVRERRSHEEEERRFGIAERGENTGRHIIEKHKRQAADVNVQIQLRVLHDLIRRVDEAEELTRQQQADQHQNSAQARAGDERGIDRRLHAAQVLRAEELRRHDGAADVAAKGKGDEDQRDLIAVADGSQRILADEFTGDKAVCDIIKLLENNAAEQRQAELPEHPAGFAGR